MTFIKPSLILLIILVNSALLSGQPVAYKNFIKDYLSRFPDNSEIAIGIIDGDHQYKYGYRVSNGSLTAVDNQSTLFEIGSITKMFTVALLMREVQKGTMRLEDPIQKHLSFQIKQDSFQNQTLKILHLVTHTSGLKKNPLMSYKRYSRYLKNFELDYLPGKNWDYNNLAFDLVGELVSEKNNTPWDVLLREKILTPLGMHDTYTNLKETPEENRGVHFKLSHVKL